MQQKTTSELPLYAGLVRELLVKLRDRGASELFNEGCLVLALADEASKLPKGSPERSVAYRELIEFQRKALAFVV